MGPERDHVPNFMCFLLSASCTGRARQTNKDQPDVARIALTTDVAKMSNCHHYMASTFFHKNKFPIIISSFWPNSSAKLNGTYSYQI